MSALPGRNFCGDCLAVYGKIEGPAVHDLIDANEPSADDRRARWIANYEEGLSQYRGRNLAGAIRSFKLVLRESPQGRPTELMLDRCMQLEKSRDSWSAVVTPQSK